MSSSAILGTILRLAGMVPAAGDQLNRVRGKLTRSDLATLAKYVKRVDERRVFFHPYDSEVIEACVGSLDQVKNFTEETLASVKHEGAKAALGGILDATRAFVDRWHGARTPKGPRWDLPLDRWSDHESRQDRTMEQFFADLGELRGAVKLMLALLQEIEPKIVTPNLSDEGG